MKRANYQINPDKFNNSKKEALESKSEQTFQLLTSMECCHCLKMCPFNDMFAPNKPAMQNNVMKHLWPHGEIYQNLKVIRTTLTHERALFDNLIDNSMVLRQVWQINVYTQTPKPKHVTVFFKPLP